MANDLRFDLAVFDMAGTTVAEGDAVHRALQEALLHTAGLRISRDEANDVMGIPKPIAIERILSARLPDRRADRGFIASIFQDFERRMRGYYESGDDVREVDGASDVFRALRESGVKVAVDT